ncbi:MAG: hypothetical protein AB7I18_01255 [Candidatus Berkiella sp.]
MSRLTQFRDAFVNTVQATKQGISSWLSRFTRRKAFAYLLVFLFTLGVLSSYVFSMPVTFIASALMPVTLELTANLVGFVIRRLTTRVIRRVNETVTNISQTPSGISEEEPGIAHRPRRGTDPDRIINALAVGDHQRALRLFADVDVSRIQGLRNIASEAIRHNDGTLFARALQIPELQARLADSNNSLLAQAAREQRADMVTLLLANQNVRDNAGASNNEALREACSIGSLPIVEALLACPNVLSNITFNHNEAYRLAGENGHFDVAARLTLIPAVANYETPRAAHLTFTPRTQSMLLRPTTEPDDFFNFLFGVAGLHRPRAGVQAASLRDFANRRENAMAQLNENQVRDLGEIQTRYQQTFNDRGIDNILAEIRGFLMEAYEKDPVKHNGRNLPIHFDRSLSNSVQALYYQHKIHTAYRYLFLHPNPWISPRPSHASNHPNGGHSATITHEHKTKIAFLWLAASDTNRPVPEGYTRAQLKQVFAELILAGAGRGHNWDQTRVKTKQVKNKTTQAIETVTVTRKQKNEITGHDQEVPVMEEYDDGLPDNPTCGWGVSQWVTQFLTIIANDSPESRPLSVQIIRNKFQSALIAEGGHKEAIFNKLNRMKKETLLATHEAIRNLVANGEEELDAAEKTLLAPLAFSKVTINEIVNQCKTFFGSARITAKQNPLLDFQATKFNTYEEVLREMAKNPLGLFYNEIDEKIEKLKKGPEAKKAKTPSANKEDTLGKVVVFSEKALGKTAPKKKAEEKENNDDKKEKKGSAKKR